MFFRYDSALLFKRIESMKKLLPTLVLGAICCASAYAATPAAPLTSDTGKLSYSMGFKTGQAMKTQSITLDTQDFTQCLQDGYQGSKPQIAEADMQTSLTAMQKQMVEKMQQKYSEVAEKNLQEGQTFLTNNAKTAGIVTLPSGLQYKVIDAGKGESPTLNDTVTVNYEGTLINGTVFDSSYKRGQPATFKVGQVIQGWQDALTHMKPGATWMLYIPSTLAYGKQGSMGAIGPNETLIFKVDLISVKKA